MQVRLKCAAAVAGMSYRDIWGASSPPPCRGRGYSRGWAAAVLLVHKTREDPNAQSQFLNRVPVQFLELQIDHIPNVNVLGCDYAPLLKRMLSFDPALRPTATEVLALLPAAI